MLKKTLLICLLLAPLNSYTIERNKALHLGVSSVIGLSSQHLTKDAYKSASVCFGVGIVKELYDEYDYGGFDIKDLKYDAVGCLLGIYAEKGLSFYREGDAVGIKIKRKF